MSDHRRILEDAEYMHPREREFVKRSVEAWESLSPEERQIPSLSNPKENPRMATYSKAIAATVAAIAAVLVVFNVEMSEEVQAAIITVATGLVTLLAPKNAD